MLRCTAVAKSKRPFNAGVAPRYDIWYEKYEPWMHMKRMARMVGTGFYIPPDWYTHFRMFPPIQNNFQQEKTLNPHSDSEPTQSQLENFQDARRKALRDELAHGSRSLASAGKRYYNLFWVQKPLDDMERRYYALERKGVQHDVAIRRVLSEYYDDLAVKKRVQLIQAEEAKLSGGFITMREAMTVLKVLSQVQEAQLAPHQYAQLAERTKEATWAGPLREAVIAREAKAAASSIIHPSAQAEAATAGANTGGAAVATTEPSSSDATPTAPAAAAEGATPAAGEPAAAAVPPPPPAEGTAEELMHLLNAEATAAGGAAAAQKLKASTKAPAGNNLPLLREQALDATGAADWYDGFDLMMDPSAPSK